LTNTLPELPLLVERDLGVCEGIFGDAIRPYPDKIRIIGVELDIIGERPVRSPRPLNERPMAGNEHAIIRRRRRSTRDRRGLG
jgi:hypothetical protein